MVIKICVGSSCHLKGSYDIIEEFKKIISDRDLESKVQLVGAFCLGRCGNHVTVKIDDEFLFLKPGMNLEKILLERLDDVE